MKSGKTRRLGQAVLGQLVAFEATARLNSFRAAADELHLTTGAVAQQIRLMEQKLGMQLFERLPRGTRLLTEAEGFLNKVQLALDLVDDATHELTSLRSTTAIQPITLSTTSAFASRWLIPKLVHLSIVEPQVSIMIDASEALRPLKGPGSVDVAIRWGEPPFIGCWACPLHSGRAIPVCSPGLKKAYRWETISDLLRSAPLIADSHDNWAKWITTNGPRTTSSVQRFSQTSLAIEAAEQGLGVALVSEVLVGDALRVGTLVEALPTPDYLDIRAGFYLLTATEPDPGSPLGRVVSWLRSKTV